jgi:hypothetical protein
VSVATDDNRVSHQDTFEEACRRADEKRRREPEPERLAQLRRLLDGSVSLERAWAELYRRRRVDAPRATVEALLYELRTHGLPAFERPSCRRRLSELSADQLRELMASLIRVRAGCPAVTDELLITLDRIRR